MNDRDSLTSLRIALNNEWHARPNVSLPPPLRCSHVVSLRSEVSVDDSRARFGAFCTAHGQPLPADGSRHHSAEVGSCLIKWEGHTEATSHTIVVPGNSQPPFVESALDHLEQRKREELLADMFIGVNIEVMAHPGGEGGAYELARALLGAQAVYGGLMYEESAEVWSAFRFDARGFIRILVLDRSGSEGRLGRLLQRLVEMETYRLLAMMALPRAREAMRSLGELEPEVDRIMDELAGATSDRSQEDLLRRISTLAGRAEQIASSNAYRFAAARAYSGIVERRIREIDECRVGPQPRYSSFLLRTLQPAMRTCEAAERRCREVAERVARAARLLDSIVDMAQKKQNQAILESMNQRSRLQLRLQQSVEGFSIFAISYYAVGLLSYGLKAAKAGGLPVSSDVTTGLAAPLILALAWFSVRRVRRRVHRREDEDR